jgi:hypothetical protein
MKSNRLLEMEMSKMLLLSRSRLQAEIIVSGALFDRPMDRLLAPSHTYPPTRPRVQSLRRENKALRQRSVTNDQVVAALTAEKRLTAVLQRLLDDREARLMQLIESVKATVSFGGRKPDSDRAMLTSASSTPAE